MGISENCEGVEGIDFSLGNSDNNFNYGYCVFSKK